MNLKKLFCGIFCVALLVCGTGAMAAEHKADEFLSLDLSKALLSPAPLGPFSEFVPYPVEAKADRGDERALARVEPTTTQRSVARADATKPHIANIHITSVHAVKPRGAARTLLAKRHRNLLDAQASDRRIQVWPCKSGGICDWRRSTAR